MQINISEKILNMAAKNDPAIDAETKKLFQDIQKINAIVGLPMNQNTENQLKKGFSSYEELMSVTENNQHIQMFTKETNGQIDEFILYISADKGGIILMSITGKIDLNQIARLSRTIKLEGMKHLDKITTKNKKK